MPNPVSFKIQNNRTVPLDCRRFVRNESVATRASRHGKVSPSAVSSALGGKNTAAAIWARTKPSAIRVQSVSIVRINSASPINVRALGNHLDRGYHGRWKHQPENCAAFRPISAFDFSAMLPHNPIARAETEAYTFAD